MDCNYAPPSPIVLPRSSTSCQLTCFLFSFVPLQDGSWFYYLGCDIRDWWGQTRTTLILTSRYCTILSHLKQCGNEVHPWRPSSLVRMFIKRDSSAVLVPVCKSVGHYPPSAMRRVFFLVSNHVNLPRVCVYVWISFPDANDVFMQKHSWLDPPLSSPTKHEHQPISACHQPTPRFLTPSSFPRSLVVLAQILPSSSRRQTHEHTHTLFPLPTLLILNGATSLEASCGEHGLNSIREIVRPPEYTGGLCGW